MEKEKASTIFTEPETLRKQAEKDDFSKSRVTAGDRYSMWKILMIRIGSFTTVSEFMIGAELGYGLSLKDALWATFLGSVILQFISYGLGVAGQQEGVSTSLLSKWAGFGTVGSAIVGLSFAISLTGWFGIQNSVFAQGIIAVLGGNVNFTLVAIITGLAVTLVVVFGFKGMSWTANVAVPGFLIVIAWATYNMLQKHSLAHLATMGASGKAMPFATAVTLVTGGFIVGCIITPDITRFAKNKHDVFWATLIGTMLGELGTNLLAVLMAHAVGTSAIMPIIYQLTGLFGIILVIFSTIKVNDINLYSSSLGIVTFFKQIFKIDLSRSWVTIIIGILGTILSVTGIINQFEGFLNLLGVVFPPIAGIMFIDYFILKRSRGQLDKSRKTNALPQKAELLNPVTAIAWIGGSLAGAFISWGIPSLTSIVVSAIIYYIGIKLFFAHKFSKTVRSE